MVKSMKEKQILKRAAEMKYPTDRLGPGSLMCQQSHINASRVIMINHQLTHMVNIKDPEPPLVPTGFEDPLSEFSTMLNRTNADYKIVAKFVKNQYNYVLIGFDKKKRVYHAWKRQELEEHSEGFATRYKNSYMDSLDVGDVVQADTLIKKSESFDKYNNYCSGRNLNTVYMISARVLEDGIVLMNGADKKMNAFRSHTVTIPMNDNELMVNWYGDDNHYQPLPNIGEKIRKGILTAVRTVDNSNAPYSLKSKKLRKLTRDDRIYYVDGRVIDIDILYNKDVSKLIDANANRQINKMYEQQQQYYRDLYDYMIGIVHNAYDEGYTYTDEFTILCEEAHDYVDASAFFADQNDNIFGNMLIKVRIMDEEKLIVGSKLVGRSGNKGVITQIIPPEESWCTEDGRPIEVLVAALGIVGRLNPSQLNEHSITDLCRTAIDMMKSTNDTRKKCDIVYQLMTYLNSDEAKSFKSYVKNLSSDEREKFCKKIERDGIYIIQDPIDNANIMDIEKVYDAFPARYQRIVYPDGRKSMKRVINAPMFYMRLKQDPFEKYSARSRGPVNPLNTLPAKSNQKKKYLEPYSDVAVRLGASEMEVIDAMCPHPAAIANFMTENSTSWDAKVDMAYRNYLGDPEEEAEIIEVECTGKKNMEVIAANLHTLGTKIVIETADAKDGEHFEDNY